MCVCVCSFYFLCTLTSPTKGSKSPEAEWCFVSDGKLVRKVTTVCSLSGIICLVFSALPCCLVCGGERLNVCIFEKTNWAQFFIRTDHVALMVLWVRKWVDWKDPFISFAPLDSESYIYRIFLGNFPLVHRKWLCSACEHLGSIFKPQIYGTHGSLSVTVCGQLLLSLIPWAFIVVLPFPHKAALSG